MATSTSKREVAEEWMVSRSVVAALVGSSVASDIVTGLWCERYRDRSESCYSPLIVIGELVVV